MSKKENFIVRTLKGIGFGIISEIMCMFLVLTMVAVSALTGGLAILKVFIGICCLIITLGLYFNWANKAAKKDRDMVKFHGMEYDRFMPLKMAMAAPIISYLAFIALILSKCGVLPDIFNVYLLINLYVLPFVDAFTDGRTLEYLNVWGIIGLAFLELLQGVTIAVTYVMTYKDVDVLRKVMYKK